MKIEIDTERASKQELAHLADMLRSLAGSSGSVVKPKDVFEESSPSGGMFNMFGDTPSAEPQSSAAPETSQPAGDGLFSLFNSSSEPAQQESTPLPTYGQSEEEEKGL
jgi:hypothetical protein